MTGSVPSEQQLLMAGYILGDLSPEEAIAFEQLLAADPSLMQELAQMQQALDLTYGVEVQPPPHLRDSILKAHQTEQHLQSAASSAAIAPASVRHPSRSWKRIWIGTLGATAAALIVGLSISNYVLWRSLQALQKPQPAENVLTLSLAATEANLSGSAQIIIDPATLEAQLQVEGLPPLAEGQVYALWTVVDANAPVTTDEKNAILTDVFTVDAQGNQLKQIALPSVFRDRSLVRAVAISIENASDPQSHRSTPILIEQL